MTSMNKSDLTKQNTEYSGQIVRSGVLIDAMYRRAGELRDALEKVIEGTMDADAAQSILNDEWINNESRFMLVAGIVDAAHDHAAGDATAIKRIDEAAEKLANYTSEKVRYGATRPHDADNAPRAKAAAKISQTDAIAAMKAASAKLGTPAVSMKDFNSVTEDVTAADVVAACGKWSEAQKLAGLEVTKRGRKKAATAVAQAA